MENGLVVSIFTAVLGSTVINGLLTHLLYSRKLKKDLKFHGNNEIAQSISNSLQEFRKIVLELKKIEIYNIDQRLKDDLNTINFISGEVKYPACFNDWGSLISVIEKIRGCREKYESMMPCKVALNLVFIERYFMQLIVFVKKHGGEKALPNWGTILKYDLDKWIKRTDVMLVKEINKYSYALESHESIKWKRLRKTELVKQFEQTILHYLITGECPFRQKKLMKSVDEVLETLISENEKDKELKP